MDFQRYPSALGVTPLLDLNCAESPHVGIFLFKSKPMHLFVERFRGLRSVECRVFEISSNLERQSLVR